MAVNNRILCKKKRLRFSVLASFCVFLGLFVYNFAIHNGDEWAATVKPSAHHKLAPKLVSRSQTLSL